jgi:RNA polymerase subunit RPABC4/transcription elongation factor Spt4
MAAASYSSPHCLGNEATLSCAGAACNRKTFIHRTGIRNVSVASQTRDVQGHWVGVQAGYDVVKACYVCGTALQEGQERCPTCGRRQYRICYCGARLPRAIERCPECGTEWRRITRRRSRRRRSRSERYYIAVGALSAVAFLGLVGALGRSLRQGGAEALANATTAVVRFVVEQGWLVLSVLLAAAIGGLAGALTYRYRRSLRHRPPRRAARRSGKRSSGTERDG